MTPRDLRSQETDRKRTSSRLRRRLAMLVSGVALALLVLPTAMAATHLPKNGNAHKVTIKETNYQFSPDHLTWTVGEKVRLTIENKAGKSGATHDFLMGKGVKYSQASSGKGHPDGWKTYLLGSDTKVAWGMGKMITQFQQGAPGQAVLKPGGKVVLQFKVPDKPGTWHFASFQNKGIDYTKGMKGTITIKGKPAGGGANGGSGSGG